MTYVLPIVMIVIFNIIYHICSKSVPAGVSPFLSLAVTYLVGFILSIIIFLITRTGEGVVSELGRVNWAAPVLGLSVVGLEAGFIYAYKYGWEISRASLVQSSFLAISLIFVGFFLYDEPLTWNKILGVLVCIAGLVLINL
ncbi:EamA family transporter [uncultured Ruminobacter sp.]|jgi:drug/metabolite transporter (DMT)-like permease|uniref:EamA family transporter n=1 Tax=Ruminobacter sp. TaxID=2774296 RepID=UPI0025D0FECD|nr:EamA family transporter [uncultured Ruminobacter sp.]